MAVIETWFNQDLQKPVQVNYLDGNLFSNNGNGNRIGVVVTNNGEAVTLTGTVSGYAVLADGTEVPCTGTRSGNKASILIPPAAYLPGQILMSIFLTDGNTVTTLAAVSSSVLRVRTDNQVDPGSVVTDWTQTINAAMQDVVDAAEGLEDIVATPYEELTFPVPLGAYTIYNHNLYRCTTPIATSESFTAAHWSAKTNLGQELSDLNRAFDLYIAWHADDVNYTPISIGDVDTSYYVTVSNTGKIYFNAQVENYGAYKIEVKPNTQYKIYNYAYYGQKWAITDKNNAMLQYDETIYNENVLTPVCSVVITDENAKWLYLPYRNAVANVKDSTARIRLIGGIVLEQSEEQGKLTLSGYWNASSTTQGYYFPQVDNVYTTKVFPVKKGDNIFCYGFDIYNIAAYALFDDEFKPVLLSNNLTYKNSAEVNSAIVSVESDGFLLCTQRNAIGSSDAFQLDTPTQATKGKKWDVIGDSFSAINTLSGKPNYVDMIKTALGFDTANYGVGGTGYGSQHGNNSFYNKALSIRTNADVVTVFGSFNDLRSSDSPILGTVDDTDTTTLAGSMATTFSNIRATAPDAMILCIAPSPWQTNNNVTGRASWASINPWDYVDMLEKICKKYNVVYLDLYHYNDTYPWIASFVSKYQADGTHPNSMGHYKYIYPFVKNKILDMLD